MTLTLASLPPEPNIRSSLVAPEPHYKYPPGSKAVEPVRWGIVTMAVGGKPVSVLVEALHHSFTVTGSDEDVVRACQAVDDAITAWWARAEMWLDIYTELNLLRHGRQGRGSIGQRYLAYSQHDDGTVRPVSWTTTSFGPLPKPFVVPDSEILARSLHLAGAGAVLPPEWQYLRDARSWLKAGETRRAVVDGCTAAEIALANQVHQLLDSTDQSVREALLSRCNGISDVAKLVRQFGGSTASINRVGEKLAKVRNDAAHAGVEPQQTDADLAVEVAAEIVEHSSPLSQLHEGY
ncbi:hypothetical protein [Nocardia rhamnosiphila]